MDAPPPPPNNQQQHPPPPQNNGLDLGNRKGFGVRLDNLIRGEMPYSIEDLQQAMNQTTTLESLGIDSFSEDTPTFLVQGFLRFLLRYIKGRNHLRRLGLLGTGGLVRRFIMSAAESKTIHYLNLTNIGCSVQTMVDFCRENRSVKVLHIAGMAFVFNDVEEDASKLASTANLDKLILQGFYNFDGLPAARKFFELAPYLKCSDLVLDYSSNVGSNNLAEHGTRLVAEETRFVATLMNAPVTRLSLKHGCTSEVRETALTNGKAFVETLYVDDLGSGSDWVALANALPDKLKVLHAVFFFVHELPSQAKKRFLRAVDACTTLTEIQVTDRRHHFSQEEMQLLQEGRIGRNNELRRFVANPDGYPERDLLKLMLQLQTCPTGLFELARELPRTYAEAAARHFEEMKEQEKKAQKSFWSTLKRLVFLCCDGSLTRGPEDSPFA